MRCRLTLVIAALALGCEDPPSSQPQPHPELEMSLMEMIRVSPCDSVIPPPQVVVALTGGDTYENEIHDCQRLILSRGNGLVFGPLVGVFPIDSAMALDDPADFDTAVAVASIYNWETRGPAARYPPLQILEGWNCLWLKRQPGAWVAEVTRATMPCDSITTEPTDWTLTVQNVSYTDEVAPSARWGWSTDETHYIGIKCGQQWCMIGTPNFQPVASLADPALSPGWYDEQHIALKDGSGRLVPGPWAALQPTDFQLGLRRTSETDMEARYADTVRVAEIILAGSSNPGSVAPYDSRFHLEYDGTVWRSAIWLFLHGAEHAWFGRTTPREPKARLRVLPATKHAATGTVRWRWQDDDETAWVSCKSGCCDIQEL